MTNNLAIKQVLMCLPNNFAVNYRINPWMKIGSVNKSRAKKQWQKLVSVYQNLGIKIQIINQNHPETSDLVFSADQGWIERKKIILANFRYQERKRERAIYQNWFEKNNFQIVKLPEDYYFEGGGEMIRWGKKYFLGFGFRSKKKTAKKIASILQKEVISLQLVDHRFYHLDLSLFILNEKVAFYYPEAFDNTSREKLKKIVPLLIPLEKKEAFNFAANSVNIDHKVVVQRGNNNFCRQLKHLHYQPIEVNVDEFLKAGGGIHCLTGLLS